MFDPRYPYGQGTRQVEHESIPPLGRTIVSADFVVLIVNNITIGVVQRFSPKESRAVMPQYEIGNIYPVEFVPSTWTGEIEVQRLEIFKDTLFDAFQYNNALTQDLYDLASYWPSNKFGQINVSGPNVNGSQTTGPIVTTLADIQWTIDMQIHINNPGPESTRNGITVITYQECWITGWATSYDAGTKVVAENVTFMYRNKLIQTAALIDNSALTVAPV